LRVLFPHVSLSVCGLSWVDVRISGSRFVA
jgi:hypothetical protein